MIEAVNNKDCTHAVSSEGLRGNADKPLKLMPPVLQRDVAEPHGGQAAAPQLCIYVIEKILDLASSDTLALTGDNPEIAHHD